LLASACGETSPPLLVPVLTGQVVFGAPLAQQAVFLHVTAPDGRLGDDVASTQTDADGRFRFAVAVPAGDYVVRVPRGESVAPEEPLLALVQGLSDGEARTVTASPWSTWEAALAEGHRLAGEAQATERARSAVRDHLGFTPSETPLAGPGDVAYDAASAHALLVRAFPLLADALSRRAVAPVSSADDLLRVLRADAAQGTVAGRMDGDTGADGPQVPGPETLRGDLANAVLEVLAEDPEWAQVDPGAFRPLLTRLRCSPSDAFPPCTAATGSDLTPPTVRFAAPADGAAVPDQFGLEIDAEDTETGVAALEAQWSTDLDPTPRAVVDLDPAPERLRARLDLADLAGRTLRVEATATNGEALSRTEGAAWSRADAGRRVVTGDVFKGPGSNVRVEAYVAGAEANGGPPLAAVYTDVEGRFSLLVEGFDGALTLVARGSADGSSRYLDEARGGEAAPWETDDTLTALVGPAGSEPTHVVLTPWTTLAYSRALGAAARDEEPALVFSETLELLMQRFDVPSPLSLRPTWPPSATLHPPGAADRALLSLGCLGEQARDLGLTLNGPEGGAFTVFDLVRLYVRDLGDGTQDGREGETQLPLPAHALRTDLARACLRWLGRGETGLRAEEVVGLLSTRVALDTSALFDPDQVPEPLDDAGPAIAPLALSAVEGAERAGRVRGVLLVTVFAEDPSGVAALELTGTPPGLLSPLPVGAPDARAWTLDTRSVGTGAVALTVTARDLLGRESTQRTVLEIDNAPPRVTASLGGRPLGAVTAVAEDPANLEVSLDEAGTVEVTVDEQPVETVAAPGPPLTVLGEVSFGGREGSRTLRVRGRDELGNLSEAQQVAVRHDRTPPRVEGVPTAYVDERGLDAWPLPESLDGRPTVRLDDAALDAEGVEIARWVNRWQADASPPNPVALVWRAVDAGPTTVAARWVFETCAAVEVAALDGEDLLGAPVALEVTPEGTVGLALDAAVLGFDPLALEAPATQPLCVQVEATDDAGWTGVRRVGVTLVRVAPALEVVGIAAADVEAPRLNGVDAGSVNLLVDGGDRVNVLGLSARNPYGDLDLGAELRLPPAAVETQVVELSVEGALQVGGFVPPACFDAWPRRPGAPESEPFLVREGNEWRCEALVSVGLGVSPVDAALTPYFGAAPLPMNTLLLRGRPNAAAQTLVVGLVPGAASASVRALAALGSPNAALGNVRFARVVQGPGRRVERPVGCAAPATNCLRWWTSTRGERLTRVGTDLRAAEWRFVTRYGRHVTLEQRIELPEELELSLE
jgi:hypothetical protein